ncbi:MAG: glycine cleavage system protein GcvH [Lentisphaerae bacterium]|nr:glycine cleavage system protein GcvH [Lentisphaerota bacterium]
MNIPKDLRYTETHEWVRDLGDRLEMGITDYAQHELSDVTYVELPAPNERRAAKENVIVVESIKAAGEVYMPVAGTVVEINAALANAPELVNNDPYGKGWLIRIKPDNKADFNALLTADAYAKLAPE